MSTILISGATAIGAGILNFITVKILNKLFGKNYNYLWKNKEQQIEISKAQVDIEELKKRLRIVVIDDEDSFPVKLFQEAGYSIEKWDSVENYSKLESGFYDIIVLDITGIARHISENDGLGVLEDLKRYNPTQIIIAYSQHSFDLSKAKFWQMADDHIAKPSDFLKIKRVINNLIETKFTSRRYLNSIEELIEHSNLSLNEKNKTKKYLSNTFNSNKKIDKDKLIEISKRNMDLVSKILTLSNAISKFFN
ncbi:MAG: hypothetical protein ACK479_04430 [Fluviicola sp.]